MTSDGDGRTFETLSPEEAFGVLGNETRVEILRVLADTEGAVSFSALRDRVGIRQGAQFNYHLDKLVGHFVAKTDRGYVLRQPGRRVVQAVLSGAVTDDPTLEPTVTDFACRHCETPVVVSYDEGEVRLSCPACGGNYDASVGETLPDGDQGNLMNMALPPAGMKGRTATGVMRAAGTWVHLHALAITADVCPRCSAAVDRALIVCEDHEAGDGLCAQCDHRLAVRLHARCTNCPYDQVFAAVMGLLDTPPLLSFVGDHGLDTTARGIEWGWDYEEVILETDPFRGRFTFTIDGDTLALTVDEDLHVLEAETR